jgi:hypothetical protein
MVRRKSCRSAALCISGQSMYSIVRFVGANGMLINRVISAREATRDRSHKEGNAPSHRAGENVRISSISPLP